MSKKESQPLLLIVILAAALGAVVSNLLTVGAVFAQKKSAQFTNVVKSENFELVDKQGKTRARLMMGTDDEPVLVVYDKNEKATAAYGLNGGEGSIQNLLGRFLRP